MEKTIERVTVEQWPPPHGYADAMITSLPGMRVLFVAGQIGWTSDHRFTSDELASQFVTALDNVLAVVRAARGEAQHVARMTIYVVDLDAYRAARKAIGVAWKERFGAHYPAMALIGVDALLEPDALVEIEATAVLPASNG